MALKQQMELFEDGGLMDEGNTIDPISGNDVPPGSTQEEVRDDIPAQLSEGEFVFPADVVRYVGLEKLMQLRQEAKQGLQAMDDMGQMGNSDEAIMSDNIPFELSDLDIEDEEEYNNDTVEMATGGLLGPSTGISGYVPSQVPATSFVQQPQAPVTPTSTPMQSSVPIAPTYTPTVQQAVPTAPTYQDVSFPDVIQTPESAPQTLEIINPTTGERRTITFIPGVTQIPEGFIRASEDTAPETTSVTPTVGQARVRKDDGDDPSVDPLKQRRIADRISAAERMGYTDFLNPLKELGSVLAPLGIGKGLLEPGKVTGTGYIVMTDGSLFDPMTGKEVSSNVIDEVKKFLTDSDGDSPSPFDPEVTSKLPGYAEKLKKAREETQKNIGKTIKKATGKTLEDYVAPAKEAMQKNENINVPNARNKSAKKAETETESEDSFAKRVSKSAGLEAGVTSGKVNGKDFEEAFNTGGLASKPKTKPKKMRSGGLASKK